ncbi:MAG: hypothetical protein QF368_19775 [SAR202 cluster bacterium]|nr:hypothetical protein [SAR202 cluster bacterium]
MAITVIGLAFSGIIQAGASGEDVLLTQPNPGRPMVAALKQNDPSIPTNITLKNSDGAALKFQLMDA